MEKKKKLAVKRKMITYTKYSGLGYQLIGLLAVSIWLGLKADAYFGNKTQYITAISCIVVLFGFFYKVYMLFGRSSEENNTEP